MRGKEIFRHHVRNLVVEQRCSDIAEDEPGNESEKQKFKERFQLLRFTVLQALRTSFIDEFAIIIDAQQFYSGSQ